jgi:peptidoglycan/xylan/chitin deacetylase (PgdA/CDA1 family)
VKRLRARAWLRSFVDRKALILMYHRVADLPSDPWALAVKPQHFDEHLAVLPRHFHVLSLDELNAAIAANRIPRLAVAITFDDGYADNLHEAKPLLERHDCPATVFLTSGAIGAKTEFWWDELERLVLQPGVLPPLLEIAVQGKVHTRELNGAACFPVEAMEQHRAWTATKSPPTGRHELYQFLWKLLYELNAADRERALEELRSWAGAGADPRPTHLPLSADEAASLARDGLVQAGAHSHSHTALATLPVAVQRDEIAGCKARLEEILGRPVRHFSYPLGRKCDYGAETVSLVRQAGFASACSNFPGMIGRSVDPYQLPRIYAGDWNGDRFARVLLRWFEGQAQ